MVPIFGGIKACLVTRLTALFQPGVSHPGSPERVTVPFLLFTRSEKGGRAGFRLSDPCPRPVDSGALWEAPGKTEPIPGEATQGFMGGGRPTPVTAPRPLW